jgi:hypothetical protein
MDLSSELSWFNRVPLRHYKIVSSTNLVVVEPYRQGWPPTVPHERIPPELSSNNYYGRLVGGFHPSLTNVASSHLPHLFIYDGPSY